MKNDDYNMKPVHEVFSDYDLLNVIDQMDNQVSFVLPQYWVKYTFIYILYYFLRRIHYLICIYVYIYIFEYIEIKFMCNK